VATTTGAAGLSLLECLPQRGVAMPGVHADHHRSGDHGVTAAHDDHGAARVDSDMMADRPQHEAGEATPSTVTDDDNVIRSAVGENRTGRPDHGLAAHGDARRAHGGFPDRLVDDAFGDLPQIVGVAAGDLEPGAGHVPVVGGGDDEFTPGARGLVRGPLDRLVAAGRVVDSYDDLTFGHGGPPWGLGVDPR
jgi:hypothetical protein